MKLAYGGLGWQVLSLAENFGLDRKIPASVEKFRSQAESSRLSSVTNIREDSAAGRLWSCGTTSLARNSRKSFLQCSANFETASASSRSKSPGVSYRMFCLILGF
jgi:hypothetical protein